MSHWQIYILHRVCALFFVLTSQIPIVTIFRRIDEFKLLFHVSTLLPYCEGDEQQLERKRHLGNDIVCVVFLEEEANAHVEHFFDPSWLHTAFTHVFFVVSPDKEMTKKTGTTHYRLAVACHAGTTPFGPRVPAPAVFPKGPELRSFLLTKLINSERAALTAPAFQARLQKVKEVRRLFRSFCSCTFLTVRFYLNRLTCPQCSSCKYDQTSPCKDDQQKQILNAVLTRCGCIGPDHLYTVNF